MEKVKKTIEGTFRSMKVGQERDFPFTSYTGVKAEQARQNKEARLLGKIGKTDIAFRVSSLKKNEGFCSVIRVK